MKGDEPAFPLPEPLHFSDHSTGMSYRRYLAAQIAGHIVADTQLMEGVIKKYGVQSADTELAKIVWVTVDQILEAE